MPNPPKVRAFCKNECGRRINPGNLLYCSNQCRGELHRLTVIAEFKAGTLEAKIYLQRPIRQYLIRKFGERCQQCGWSQRHAKTGRVPLEIEHIDGNWRNLREDNLTVLCPNCHALTLTFKGLIAATAVQDEHRQRRWSASYLQRSPPGRKQALAMRGALLRLGAAIALATLVSPAAQSAAPGPGFVTERGHITTLGASDATLFDIPAGYTKQP